MRTRVITVPKDKKAEEALDFDIATEEQLIELALSEEEFYFLDRSGVIDLINSEGNTIVDDFEADSVTGTENLSKVIEALSSKEFAGNSSQLQVVQSVLTLFKEAFHRNTGVYFFF
jgi:hypothetical protein